MFNSFSMMNILLDRQSRAIIFISISFRICNLTKITKCNSCSHLERVKIRGEKETKTKHHSPQNQIASQAIFEAPNQAYEITSNFGCWLSNISVLGWKNGNLSHLKMFIFMQFAGPPLMWQAAIAFHHISYLRLWRIIFSPQLLKIWHEVISLSFRFSDHYANAANIAW